MSVDPIPEEYGSLVVQLVCGDANAAIAFYVGAFGAGELYRQLEAAGPKIVYSEILLGRSRAMVHDEFPERGLLSPTTIGGTPTTLMLYVEDVDATYAQALAHGARGVSAPEDKFWGVRSALVLDPEGHRWLLASRTEDLSPVEILERAQNEPPSARVPEGG
jgi:PhnB protein